MNITQITVSYGETQSLPEYSNVKPNLTITTTLNDGDDPTESETLLWQHVKSAVREQIDQALEANGKAAKWSDAPRYQVMQTYWSQYDHKGETKPPQYVIILPNEINPDRDTYAQKLVHAGHYSSEARKLRYAHALRIATDAMQNGEYALLDCSNGDLSSLKLAISAPEYAPTPELPF